MERIDRRYVEIIANKMARPKGQAMIFYLAGMGIMLLGYILPGVLLVGRVIIFGVGFVVTGFSMYKANRDKKLAVNKYMADYEKNGLPSWPEK